MYNLASRPIRLPVVLSCYHTTSALMKWDGVYLFCIYWYNLASRPISLPVVSSSSRLVLLFITESSVLLLRLNYWYLYQCHKAQDRTIADWQNTTALNLTFKNRHTKVLQCFFQRCNSFKLLPFIMNLFRVYFLQFDCYHL